MKKRFELLVALTLALVLVGATCIPADATQLLSIRLGSKAEYVRLLRLVPEARDCGAVTVGEAMEFAASSARAEEMRRLGFDVEIQIEHLESYFASRLTREGPFGAYHTYDEAIAAMDSLAIDHPAIMTPKYSLGQSIEGRELWIYKLSDNPDVDEEEPEIFFNSYIHAREVITFEILHDLAQYLVEGYGTDPRATAIIDDRELWIMPVVNPDGVEYNYQTDPNGGGMWRKNRRDNGGGSYGVDLNRNFGYQWGYDNEGSSPYAGDETYRGTGPFSEPETAAIRDFVNGREFALALNYHSYGNLNLYSWGYDQFHCEDHESLLRLGRIRGEENGYAPGVAWEMLYLVNGDANDWMYGEQQSKAKILSLVTEVGSSSDNFWPSESRIPQLVVENREGNLRMIELADNPQRVLPPGIASVDTQGPVPTSFTLEWSVAQPDPDNPAVEWNLIEGSGHFVGADDFEGDHEERWSSIGWTLVTNRSHSPSHSFFGGNDNRLNNTLESQRAHLVQPGEQLRFWTYYSIETDWDYGYVEIATNAREFASLQGTITTNDDPYGRNFGNGITGSSGGWVEAVFDLSNYEGEQVWVRFRYNTDGYVTGEGWYVDDIEPVDLFAAETLIASGLGSPEYAFTDHPVGEFGYLVQSVDVEEDRAVYGAPRRIEVEDDYSDLSDNIGVPVPWKGLELLSPNPVSGDVALRFEVPATSQPGDVLLLTIYDINGREVAVLESGRVGCGAGAGAAPGASIMSSGGWARPRPVSTSPGFWWVIEAPIEGSC